MKKSLLYLFMFVCSVSLFSSCGDDDEVIYPIDTDIAGNYKGTLDITLSEMPIGSNIPKNITISKAGNASVNMELKDFSFMNMDLGTITLTNCVLTKDGDNYKFSGKQVLNVEKYLLTGDIDAQGTISGNTVVVNLDIAAKLDGVSQAVKVIYQGTKLSGSENNEAKIISFTFETNNEANAIVIEQPQLDEATNTFTFRINEENYTPEALKALVPTIIVSEKAVYSVEGGKADFSADVVYTVVAENGTVAKYTVKPPVKSSLMKYSFNDGWAKKTVALMPKNPWLDPQPIDELATSNGGAMMLNGENPIGWPAVEEENGYEGAAVKLITIDARKHPLGSMAPITAGSLFTGKFVFDIGAALSNPLSLTKFGLPYTKKPVLFKGVYKYTQGDNYIDGSDKNNVKDGLDIEDECSIQAVLYEAVDKDGKDVTLTGNDINSSEYRVAVAQLADGKAKSDWTSFSIAFKEMEGKSYDSEKQYKLAIVCSSSKDGDKFQGASGSTLIVDDLEVIGE